MQNVATRKIQNSIQATGDRMSVTPQQFGMQVGQQVKKAGLPDFIEKLNPKGLRGEFTQSELQMLPVVAAGVGGAGGALFSKRKNKLRNAIVGALGGGLTGLGASTGYQLGAHPWAATEKALKRFTPGSAAAFHRRGLGAGLFGGAAGAALAADVVRANQQNDAEDNEDDVVVKRKNTFADNEPIIKELQKLSGAGTQKKSSVLSVLGGLAGGGLGGLAGGGAGGILGALGGGALGGGPGAGLGLLAGGAAGLGAGAHMGGNIGASIGAGFSKKKEKPESEETEEKSEEKSEDSGDEEVKESAARVLAQLKNNAK